MRRILAPVMISLVFALPLPAQEFLNHFTAEAGAGFSFPLGAPADHMKTGFNFVATAGPRFNEHFTLTVDFSLHYLDVKNTLQDPQNSIAPSLGSIVRIWSLTLNPGYEFIKQERFSSYATAGYGLYNRRLLLAAPGPIPITICDQFWDICVMSGPFSNQTISGNLGVYTGGYNAGGGVTFGTRTKFFIEARYHRMFTAKHATQLVPLSFGIRW